MTGELMQSATGLPNLVQDSEKPSIAESRFSQRNFALERGLWHFFSLDPLAQRTFSPVALRDSIQSAVTAEEVIVRLGGLSADLGAVTPCKQRLTASRMNGFSHSACCAYMHNCIA